MSHNRFAKLLNSLNKRKSQSLLSYKDGNRATGLRALRHVLLEKLLQEAGIPAIGFFTHYIRGAATFASECGLNTQTKAKAT